MRLKGVLASFLFVLTVVSLTMIFFIQTESFGNLLTKVLADLSRKKADAHLSIKKVKFSLYPLGLELHKVEIKKQNTDIDFSSEIGTIGIYLNLLEIEDQRISLGELKLKESYLRIKFKQNQGPVTEIKKEILDEIFKYPEALPLSVDTVSLENAIVEVNEEYFEIKRIKLFKEKNEIRSRVHLANLKLQEFGSIPIDEVVSEIDFNKKIMRLNRLKIISELNEIILTGKINNYPLLKRCDLKISGSTSIYLKTISEKFFQDYFLVENGLVKGQFEFALKDNKIITDSSLVFLDLKSNILDAEKINLKLSINNDKIFIKDFNLYQNNSELQLKNNFQLYNYKTKVFFPNEVKLSFKNFEIKNGLKYFGKSFDVLNGKVSGDGSFLISEKALSISLLDDFEISNFILSNPSGDLEILKIKKIILSESNLDFKDDFKIQASVKLPNSDFRVQGFLSKKHSKLKVENGYLNFSDLGNVAQLGLMGEGDFNFSVTGPLQKPSLNIQGIFNNLELLKYQLGNSEIDVDVNLADSKVKINNLESRLGSTPISGSGIVNYRTKDIYLGINTKNAKSNDLKKVLFPIFNKLSSFPSELSFESDLDVYIFGKYNLKDLKIKSDVILRNILFHDEKLDSGSFSFEMKDSKLNFDNIQLSKGLSSIDGFFKYSLKNDLIDLKIVWDNFWISKFNFIKKYGLNFDGLSVGKIVGKGPVDDYSITMDGILTSTKSSSFFLQDSKFLINITPAKILGDMSVFGEQVNINFTHFLKKIKKSRLDVKVNIPNIAVLFSILSPKIFSEENPSGKIKLSTFLETGSKKSDLNFLVTFNDLLLKSEKFNFSFSSQEPSIKITNGHVDYWKFFVQNENLAISSLATGDLGANFKSINHVNFNSQILDFFSSRILSGEGKINNKIIIESNFDEFDIYANSLSDGLSISLEKSPLPLNDIHYNLELLNNRLFIKKFIAKLDSGNIQILGDILFNKKSPDINLKYILDKAEIPVLDKSSFIVSGEGILLGNETPYVMSGDLEISKFNILNELNDFQKKSVSQIKYLPKTEETLLEKNLKLNLRTKFSNPIRVTNSLMDFNLSGELSLTGNPRRPQAEGRLYSTSNASRVFFKNNEYLINNADFNFSAKKDISNPDFDIQATTIISNTKITGKAYGDLERFNFDLTSDPAMPRNSILSLIAFGYTDEIQNSLTQEEQQSLTQVGVGSFVFDRFKISDILNKQFGLQVNLGTVFEQSQTQSMLSGRSQDNGQGLVGRTRSATKIELKKRLDEAMTLSVSSTMGGSIGQRQSMNLTYSLSKKVQLEGVYELRTNAEGEEDVIDNSVGGDLKFRWTFK